MCVKWLVNYRGCWRQSNLENSCLPKYIYIKIVVKTFTCQITHIDILDSATFGLNVRPDLIIHSIILLHTLVF